MGSTSILNPTKFMNPSRFAYLFCILFAFMVFQNRCDAQEPQSEIIVYNYSDHYDYSLTRSTIYGTNYYAGQLYYLDWALEPKTATLTAAEEYGYDAGNSYWQGNIVWARTGQGAETNLYIPDDGGYSGTNICEPFTYLAWP